MTNERLGQIVDFCRLIDKEKFIQRRTYLTDGKRLENDAEHAWHMAIMALLLSEYSNEPIDLLKVVSIVLIHDLVEVYAGDTFAYDIEGLKSQKERENAAAEKLFSALPEDLAVKFHSLWDEFEAWETPYAPGGHRRPVMGERRPHAQPGTQTQLPFRRRLQSTLGLLPRQLHQAPDRERTPHRRRTFPPRREPNITVRLPKSTPGLNFSFNNALTINTNTYPEQKITVDSKGFGTPQNPHVKTPTTTQTS